MSLTIQKDEDEIRNKRMKMKMKQRIKRAKEWWNEKKQEIYKSLGWAMSNVLGWKLIKFKTTKMKCMKRNDIKNK